METWQESMTAISNLIAALGTIGLVGYAGAGYFTWKSRRIAEERLAAARRLYSALILFETAVRDLRTYDEHNAQIVGVDSLSRDSRRRRVAELCASIDLPIRRGFEEVIRAAVAFAAVDRSFDFPLFAARFESLKLKAELVSNVCGAALLAAASDDERSFVESYLHFVDRVWKETGAEGELGVRLETHSTVLEILRDCAKTRERIEVHLNLEERAL